LQCCPQEHQTQEQCTRRAALMAKESLDNETFIVRRCGPQQWPKMAPTWRLIKIPRGINMTPRLPPHSFKMDPGSLDNKILFVRNSGAQKLDPMASTCRNISSSRLQGVWTIISLISEAVGLTMTPNVYGIRACLTAWLAVCLYTSIHSKRTCASGICVHRCFRNMHNYVCKQSYDLLQKCCGQAQALEARVDLIIVALGLHHGYGRPSPVAPPKTKSKACEPCIGNVGPLDFKWTNIFEEAYFLPPNILGCCQAPIGRPMAWISLTFLNVVTSGFGFGTIEAPQSGITASRSIN
jgi:hypothetical protein